MTYSLPAFSLAADETLYVEFWRHQTQGINTNTASRRRLEFHVNDGSAFITHPPADDAGPTHSLSVVELTNPGGQYFDAATATHYYSTAAGGSFRVEDAATDAVSGVAQVTFPTVSLPGFTHTASGDGASPYQSNTYTWTTANTTSPGTQAIVAADNALNTSSPSPAFTITRDATGPGAFSLSAPSAGAAIRDGQAVSAAPSDAGAGVASVEFRHCPGASCSFAAGTTIGFVDTSAPYSVTWTGQPADGTYTLLARATDNVGNTTDSAQRTITVDNTAPGSTLSVNEGARPDLQHFVPGADTLYYNPAATGDFTVSDAATDAGGVASVDFPALADTGFTGAAKSDPSSPFDSNAYTFTSANLAAPGVLTVVVADAAGNTTTDALAFVRDVTRPGAYSLTAPSAGAAIRDGQTVSAAPADAAAGLASVELRHCPGATCTYAAGTTIGFVDTSAPYSVTWSGQPADGTYTLLARATDNVGNTTDSAQRTITVDNGEPGAVFDFPAAASVYNAAGWNAGCAASGFCGTASDATSGVAGVDISIERVSSGLYWSGGSFSIAGESFLPATLAGSSWSYAFPASSFPADGDYTVHVRATDVAGNVEPGPSRTFTIDTAEPQTTLDSSPADPSGSSSAGFDFSASEAGSTFECELDGSGFSPCSSPRSYSSLADGSHTFRVRATDPAGNVDSTPASYTWTVDTAAPQTTIDSSPADPTNATGASFDFSASESGSSFECELDGSGFSACTSPESYSGLADGPHTFRVRATDAAGNTDATPAAFTWTVDTAAPQTTIDSSPADPTYATGASFDFSASEGGSAFECELDGSGFSACTSPESYAGLGDGSHTFRVRATDAAGNTDPTPDSFTWTVDTAAPQTTIDSNPADPPSATGAGFDFSASEGGSSFECEPDGSGFSACTSPESYSGLADGPHTFKVRATDPAGNTDATPATYAWTVDIDAPDTSIDSSPTDPTNAVNAAFSFVSDEPGSTFECRIDGGGFSACTSPKSYSGLSEGSHTFEVRATDAAGNTDPAPASFTWTVDTAAPQTTIDSSPADPTIATGASFTFSASEGGSTFECELDGGGFSACTSLESYAGLADGLHTFQVRATDPAGNTDASPATHTWTVDTVDPTGSLTTPADGAFVRGTVAVSSDSADAGSGVDSVLLERRPSGGGAWTPIATDTSVPYSVDWDTSAVADGDYELRAVTTDAAGNAFISPARSLTVDNTAPSSAVLDPLPAAIRNGQELTGSGADAGSGVDSLTYVYCAGTSCTPSSPVGSSSSGPAFAVTWSSQPADGDHQVLARVMDRAGNTLDSAKRTVIVDNTSPTGSLTAPANGAGVSGTVAVSSDSADAASGVATALFERRVSGGGAWASIGTDSTAPYSVDWDTAPLADGDYDLRAVTTDSAGNAVVSATRTVAVDNNAPTVSLTAPSGFVNSAAPDPFTVTAASPDGDVAGVEFFSCSNASLECDAGSWASLGTDMSVPYEASWPIDADGNRALRAVATDGASNTGEDVVDVTIDRTAPSGSLTAPAEGAFVSGTVAVASDSADAGSGVSSAVFERRPAGGGAWTEIGTDTFVPYTVDWDTSALADGDYDLRVVTTDAAGNSATSAAWTVTVDNGAPSAPAITLDESSPFAHASGTEIFLNTDEAGSYDVTATASDGGSGIDRIAFPGGSEDTSPPYEASYAFGELSAGQTVTAYDRAGNNASSAFTVTADTTGPAAFALTAPAAGAAITDGAAVSANPADAGAGVDTVEFRYCAGTSCSFAAGTPIGSDASAPFSVAWSDQPADGTYTLLARATDHVGNATLSNERVVTVDNSGPSGSLDVVAGARPDLQWFDTADDTLYYNPAAAGDFTLTASASDPAGVQSVDFPAVSETGFTGAAVTDTTVPYASGAYSFASANTTAPADAAVVVTDVLGNATSLSLSFVRDVSAPAGGSVSYPDGYDPDGQVIVSVDAGTDALSGVDAASAVLERRTAPLAGGACDPFAGPWSPVTSPDTVASGLCAQYRHRVSDRVGNEAVYASGNVVKVDLTAPAAPALTLTEASPHAHVSGTEIFVNTGETGSYDVEAATGDAAAGIDRVGFPGGVDDTTPSYAATYALADLDGVQTVTAHDKAGNTASSTFTVTPDTAAPGGGSVSYAGGYEADGQVTVTIDAGTDALAGVDAASAVLERRTAPLAGGACDPFTGPWSPLTSPDTVASGLCAQYRYRVSDRVGNEAVYTSGNVVKVDLTAPAAPALTLTESSPHAYVSGNEIFVNTDETGSYDVEATSADPQSGIDEVRFPGGIDDTTSPYTAGYGFSDLSGLQSVSALNGAGLSASATFTVTPDTTAPSTGDDTAATGSDWKTAPVTVTLAPSDAGAGVGATHYTTDGSAPTTSSPEGTSVELSADGVYTIRYFSVDRVGNAEPAQTASTAIRIDRTDPSTPEVTLTETSPYAHVAGDEIFFNPAEAGDYTVSATAGDATSGLEKIRFPGPEDDFASPYSTVYGFGELSGAQSVTAYDNAGNTASAGFTVTPDAAAPSGGSVSYPNGYDDDGEVTVTVDAGTDALSGVDASSAVLERRIVGLAGGVCASFGGGWVPVTSPDTVPHNKCAQYRYRVSDRVGNEAVYASGNVVKVDLSAPQTTIDAAPGDPSSDTTPSFEFSASEPASTFECELDGGGFSACTSPHAIGPLADGSHTIRVRAADHAGNVDATPASQTWTVDTAAPDTDLESTPANPSNDDSPSFELSASEPGASFECELDGGGFSACASPQPIGPLADGSHTFRARAIDAAGNADPTPASYTWTVDATAPETSFTVVPANPSNDTGPTFEFSASEPGSTFECELDGGGFSACTSPHPIGPLADGSHTLAVRATDLAGNPDPTPEAYAWTVDASAPTVALMEPAGFVNVADADPYTVRATSPDGDVASVEFFRCSDSSAGCATGTWISLGTDGVAPFEGSWPVDADGGRALRAVATDAGSNTGEDVVDVTIDRTLPATTVDSAPSDPTASAGASFAFSASETSTFECDLDGGGFAPCASPKSYAGLADGSHTFRVRATDVAGNLEAAPQEVAWTVDTAAPQTAIDVAPVDPSATAAANFEFSASEAGSTFECELDGSGFAPCASPKSYAGLADGEHTFRVRATDPAGNVEATPVSHTWTIDATPPGGGLADPGENLRATVVLTASPSDTGVGVRDVEFQRSPADADAWMPIGTDVSVPYEVDWDTMTVADGLYDLRVVVTDKAGNAMPSTVVADRRVDNTPPSAALDDPGSHLRATVELTATAGDTGSSVASVAFERSLAGASTWAATAASWDTTAVADGLYDLRVVVSDAAGNSTVSAPVTNRRVDNTAPAVSSSTPADGATLGSAVSLQLAATEDVAQVANATIDGAPAGAGVVAGSTVTWFGPFPEGPHTLAGELEDLAGNRRPIRVHFTVWSLASADAPYVEKNAYAGMTTSLRSSSDTATVTLPAGAWSGGSPGDWLVLRVDPQPAAAVPAGFNAVGDMLDVTAYWALTGTPVHEFGAPIELDFDSSSERAVPATLEDGSWRPIPRIASGETLPGSWVDGFYRDGANVVVLTRHLSFFTLLEDVKAPTVPKGFKGSVTGGKLTLAWKGSTDASGIAGYLVYADGSVVRTLGAGARSTSLGTFRTSDRRSFQVAAEDVAGNVSAKSRKLRVVPQVARLEFASAKKSLANRGFALGEVTYRQSDDVANGAVVRGSAAGVRPAGSKIGLLVSTGSPAPATTDSETPPPAPAAQAPAAAGATPPPPAYDPPPISLAPTFPAPGAEGAPAPAPAAEAAPETESKGAARPRDIRPQPLAVHGQADARKELGYCVLVLALGALMLAALRLLRGSRRPPAPATGLGPLVLWDARLLHLAASALHRLAGRR
ncbi:MAG: OmpL47-type beta-barrel domain-containing protein [Gaiellaceae bacterium]